MGYSFIIWVNFPGLWLLDVKMMILTKHFDYTYFTVNVFNRMNAG